RRVSGTGRSGAAGDVRQHTLRQGQAIPCATDQESATGGKISHAYIHTSPRHHSGYGSEIHGAARFCLGRGARAEKELRRNSIPGTYVRAGGVVATSFLGNVFAGLACKRCSSIF